MTTRSAMTRGPAAADGGRGGTRCGAQKRDGTPCRLGAGQGTSHPGFGTCKLHLGSTDRGKLAAAKQEALAAMPVMGLPIDIDPAEALLHCVRITAGEVMYATERVHELDSSEATLSFRETTTSSNGSAVRATTDATVHLWIKVRMDAVDRLARFSKMALDVGVAERQVRIAEEVGGMIGRLVSAVLADLALTPAQAALAPEVVRRHLTVLEAKVPE